jgi:plastocyanin
MRRIAAALTATVLMVVAILGMFVPGTAHAQSTENVEVGNLYFCSPSFQDGVCETTITAGDTVVWNGVAGLHTVTQCNADYSVCPPGGGFDSGLIGTGAPFSQTFNAPGTFTYWCSLHPSEMRGRIIVQEPTPTPAPAPPPSATPMSAAGTVSPMPAATASPAVVPQTGAAASAGSAIWFVVALAGIAVAVLGGAVAFRLSSGRK